MSNLDLRTFVWAQLLVICVVLVVTGLAADWFVKRQVRFAINTAIVKIRDEAKQEFAAELKDAKAKLRKDVAEAWAEAARTGTRSKLIGSSIKGFVEGVKSRAK